MLVQLLERLIATATFVRCGLLFLQPANTIPNAIINAITTTTTTTVA